MQLGDLTDGLLDMGKEKAKEMAEGLLGEQEAEGGLKGTAAGYGMGLIDSALGGGDESREEASSEADSGDDAEDNDDSDDDK